MSKEVFSETVRKYGTNVVGLKPSSLNCVGDVGLELEAEGTIYPIDTPYWTTIADGSLRVNGKEYILRKPVPYVVIDEPLTEFEDLSKNMVFLKSPRTSCHVHWNVQNYTLAQVYAIIGAYWLFEDILVDFCGPTRVGNLFCLRASDAKAIVTDVLNSLKANNSKFTAFPLYLFGFGIDSNKYSALNLSSVARFGSIEFRSMRGIYKKKEIKLWVDILQKLVTSAAAAGSPNKVYDIFKEATPDELVDHFFGQYSSVIKAIPYWAGYIKQSSLFLGQLANVFNRAEKGEYDVIPGSVSFRARAKKPFDTTQLTAIWTNGPVFADDGNGIAAPVAPHPNLLSNGHSLILADNFLPAELDDDSVHNSSSVVDLFIMSSVFGDY